MSPSCGTTRAVSSSVLRALAALLQEGSCTVDTPAKDLCEQCRKSIPPSVAAALEVFEETGRRCLKELGPDVVGQLRRLPAPPGLESVPSPKNVPFGATLNLPEESARKVKLLFDQFDTDRDGSISRHEFRESLLALGLAAHLDDEDMDILVDCADKNRDGAINLQEFGEWLYSSEGVQIASSTPTSESRWEDDAGAETDSQRLERTLRRQLCEAREELEALRLQLKTAEDRTSEARATAEARATEEARAMALRASTKALRDAEEAFDTDMEEIFEFWRSVCNASAAPTLGALVDLRSASLLGNGKYAFVIRARKVDGGPNVVVKLMGIRWAHVAAKEMQQARAIGDHRNIVAYEDALLHHDEDQQLVELLRAGQEAGKLQGRGKRASFPTRYLCLIEEYMNRGTVQDWMDKEMLPPGGLLVVMQRVAQALAYMHAKGATHNDIKPENVLLHQADERDPRSQVAVKLADLGLAQRSRDRTADFQQYGLTVHSMTTGERFGTRKFRPEMAPDLVGEVSALTGGDDLEVEEGLPRALRAVPELLRQVWAQELTMDEVADSPDLEGWKFFDGEFDEGSKSGRDVEKVSAKGVPEQRTPTSSRRLAPRIDPEEVLQIGNMSARFRNKTNEALP